MEASVLTLGTWEMGGGSVWTDTDDDVSLRIIHEAGERGINIIDTAPLYGMGHAEEIVGRAVADRRERYLIASKFTLNWEGRGEFQFHRDGYDLCAGFTPQSVELDLEGSLKRLGTDYLDIYYAHRNIPEPMVPGVIEVLQRLKKQGKIRAIGLSNTGEAQFRAFQEAGCLDIIEEKYSILDTGSGRQFFPLCKRHGITYHAYSVLARGILTGRLKKDTVVEHQAHSAFGWFDMERRRDIMGMLEGWQRLCEKYSCTLSNLALAWTLAQSEQINVIFGVRRLENLRNSILSTEISLEAEDIARMDSDAAALRNKYGK